MGTFYSIGVVKKGDFQGKYVAKWSKTEWGIAPAAKFTTSQIFGGLRYPGGNWRGPVGDEIISEQTVDHFVELGQQETEMNVDAVAKGTLWFGPIGGVIANQLSKGTTCDVAIYMKNGKKFVVHFSSSAAWQDMKTTLFSL